MEKRKYWASFILGGLVGAVAVAAVTHSFPWCRKNRGFSHDPQHRLERMSRELDLKDAQKTEVRKILEASHAKMKALHNEAFPKFKAIHESTKAEIRSLLEPQQQSRFDRMAEKFEKKMDRWSRAF